MDVVDVLDLFFAGEFDGDKFVPSLPVVLSSPSNRGLLILLIIELRAEASSWVSVEFAITATEKIVVAIVRKA